MPVKRSSSAATALSASSIVQGRYVVGISWHALVTRGRAGGWARRRARAQGANWFVHPQGGRCVGAALLPTLSPWRLLLAGRTAPSHYAMAWLAALSCVEEIAFFALRVPGETRVWTCAVADGMPLNGFDALVPPQEVPAILQALLQRCGIDLGQCAVHGDADGLPAGAQALSWAAVALHGPNEPGARLRPILRFPGWRTAPPRTAPVPGEESGDTPRQALVGAQDGARGTPVLRRALLLVGALTLTGAAWAVLQLRRDGALAPRSQGDTGSGALQGGASGTEVDPAAEKARAIAQWAVGRAEPGPAALRSLLQAVEAAPARLAGWQLMALECRLAGKAWQCRALFERPAQSPPEATTAALLAALPAGWIAHPRSLERVETEFALDVAAALGNLRIERLQTASWHRVHTASTLQRMQRALTGVQLGEFAPGTPAAGAVAVPVVTSTLQLSGPLRSLALQDLLGLEVSWNSLTVQLAPTQAPPDLRTSTLAMRLTGEIHALP